MKPSVSVLICTYNRADFLAETLPTLATQTAGWAGWELLVVDNNSADDTKGVVTAFLAAHPELSGRYVFEPVQGLSQARNRGYAEAAADWVFYLDDDAKAREDLIERLKWLVAGEFFDIVGGVYYPWYRFGKPTWFKDEYGSNKLPISQLAELRPPHSASGGVMLWRKDILENLSGFDTEVGMNGNVIAYGEESFLQARARNQGVVVGYDPELVIFHVVMEQKLHLEWFFKANFASGRDAVIGRKIPTNATAFLRELVMMYATFAKDLLRFTPRLFKDDYYRQNWAIDVFRPVAKRVGTLYTLLLRLLDPKTSQ